MTKKPTRRSDRKVEQDTLIAKSESMAKEHSMRRELRRREERVKRLSPDTQEGASKRQPAPKQESERKKKRKRPPTPPESSNAKSTSSSGRLSAPFPPLRSSSQSSAPAPAPEAHDTAPERQMSAADRMAIELEALFSDMKRGWRKMHRSDRICIWASVGTFLGVFMPWLSLSDRPFQIGLMSGGIIHAALAVTAIALVLVQGDTRSIGASRKEQRKRERRNSVYHILLSAVSSGVGALLFLMWGFQKGDISIEFHFGVYWTLLCGTGLGYGGFVRFVRPSNAKDLK
jgi:hypothetical protein